MSKPELLGSGGAYAEFGDAGKVGSETIAFRRERQGAANTLKIKVVCTDCNNGWMSALETAVKPVLIPLMTDGLITLNSAAKITLVEWITLKMLVAEHVEHPGVPADPIFEQPVRTDFMKSRAIPEGIRIWITRQKGRRWHTGFFRYGTTLARSLTPDPPEPQPGAPKNVQACTWGVGRVLIHFYAATSPTIYETVSMVEESAMRRIWPMDGKNILWPIRDAVDDKFADAMSADFERFLMSDAVLKHRTELPEDAIAAGSYIAARPQDDPAPDPDLGPVRASI
jgi:hypothetical protein